MAVAQQPSAPPTPPAVGARKLSLSPNVPVHVDVSYIDVVSGRHGPQVRIRGLDPATGDAVVFYGAHDPVFDALSRAGVLGRLPEYDVGKLPERGVALRVVAKRITMLKAQTGSAAARLLISIRDGEPAGGAVGSATDPAAPTAQPSAPPVNGVARALKQAEEDLEASALFVLNTMPDLFRAAGIEPTAEAMAELIHTHHIDRRRI